MQRTRQIRILCGGQDRRQDLSAEKKADDEGYLQRTKQITRVTVCAEGKEDNDSCMQKTRQLTRVTWKEKRQIITMTIYRVKDMAMALERTNKIAKNM